MKINPTIRTAIGVALVTFGIIRQGPDTGNIGNAAWAIVVLTGLILLVPALKAIKGKIFSSNEGSTSNSKMLTAKLFYFGAVVGTVMALSYKEELSRTGRIYVGRGYSYSISASSAKKQITACFFGGAASLVIAVILHIRARRLH